MAFAVNSIDDQALINNAVGLARAAKIFVIPVILTTIAEKSFSGPIFSQLQEVFPDHKPIDRTNMNFFEDENVVKEIKKAGRKKVIDRRIMDRDMCGIACTGCPGGWI